MQLYVGFPASTGEPPNQLKGFAKVALEPGKRKRVKMGLDASSFATRSTADGAWVVYRVGITGGSLLALTAPPGQDGPRSSRFRGIAPRDREEDDATVRVGAIAEGPIERVLLAFDAAPRPLAETILPLVLARAIMAATRHGLFDALARGAATAGTVARRCALDPTATLALLEALEAAGYVARGRKGRWNNSSVAARWLAPHRGRSVRDYVVFCYHEWDILEHLDEFLRTGRPLAIHKPARVPTGFWEGYVRGMRALASLAAGEIARRIPLRRDARHLLDVGGAHGEYAKALCGRYPRLVGEVLDLTPAVRVGRRLARSSGAGRRLRFRAGDALRVRLPKGRYDGCLVVNLLHHLAERDGRRLVARLAAALAPGGIIAIVDAFRAPNGRAMSQMEGLLSLHFRLTSAAPLPLEADVTGWLRDAELVPRASLKLRRAPGATLLLAERALRAG